MQADPVWGLHNNASNSVGGVQQQIKNQTDFSWVFLSAYMQPQGCRQSGSDMNVAGGESRLEGVYWGWVGMNAHEVQAEDSEDEAQ